MASVMTWLSLSALLVGLYAHFYWTREWHLTAMAPGLIFGWILPGTLTLICFVRFSLKLRQEPSTSLALVFQAKSKLKWIDFIPNFSKFSLYGSRLPFLMTLKHLLHQTKNIQLQLKCKKGNYLKSSKDFPFEKARRIPAEEVTSARKAIEAKNGKKRVS